MPGELQAVSADLGEMIRDLKITTERAKKLTDILAESEGRYDLWVRPSDFGSVVKHRRKRPSLWDKDGDKIAAAHISKKAPLPVKTGRFAAGWNWRIKTTRAVVTSQVSYASYARKVGEDEGAGLKKVEKFLKKDWDKVAHEMAKEIEGWLT